MLHKVERAVGLETDAPEVVNMCIRAVKKGGRIALIGDYFAYANHVALGVLMEKAITVRGGQVRVTVG
jgi:threonine dehydrogenase-like Zn-dependent dehydrogenase